MTASFGSQSPYPPSSSKYDDLSSARNNLTTIFDESDLLSAHQSRTTQTGFRLDDRRLNQIVPTPPAKQADNC
jgi:hypothetical protein